MNYLQFEALLKEENWEQYGSPPLVEVATNLDVIMCDASDLDDQDKLLDFFDRHQEELELATPEAYERFPELMVAAEEEAHPIYEDGIYSNSYDQSRYNVPSEAR